jgi:hypothetical protein
MNDYHESIVLTDLSLNLDWDKTSVTEDLSKPTQKVKNPKLP